MGLSSVLRRLILIGKDFYSNYTLRWNEAFYIIDPVFKICKISLSNLKTRDGFTNNPGI